MAETSKLENVISSVMSYLNTQLGGTYSIDADGAELDTESETQWIQPRFLESQRTFIRNYNSTERGYITYLPLSVNIFIRAVALTDIYKRQEIRDAVFAKFKPLTAIDFTDNVGSGAAGGLGTITCWDIMSDTALENKDGLLGWNITILLRYEESY
jgi:hypothetical protein